MEKIISKSSEETQRIAKNFAQEILHSEPRKTAVVLALQGDLGAGKTTFLQGFAEGLRITEKILSPTFIVMKRFSVSGGVYKNFYHFDCYRLQEQKEILLLGFKDIIKNPENIVAIEWPEKIKKYIPKNAIYIKFKHLKENIRELTIHLS